MEGWSSSDENGEDAIAASETNYECTTEEERAGDAAAAASDMTLQRTMQHTLAATSKGKGTVLQVIQDCHDGMSQTPQDSHDGVLGSKRAACRRDSHCASLQGSHDGIQIHIYP